MSSTRTDKIFILGISHYGRGMHTGTLCSLKTRPAGRGARTLFRGYFSGNRPQRPATRLISDRSIIGHMRMTSSGLPDTITCLRGSTTSEYIDAWRYTISGVSTPAPFYSLCRNRHHSSLLRQFSYADCLRTMKPSRAQLRRAGLDDSGCLRL